MAQPAVKIAEPEPSEPKPKAPYDRAAEAVRDLIIEAINSSNRKRFSVAERLCRLGRELAALAPAKQVRVRDYDDEDKQKAVADDGVAMEEAEDGDDGDVGVNIVNGGGYVYAGGYGPRRARPLTDRDQLMHDMLMTIGPHLQAVTEEKKTRIARDEAEEYLTLKKIMDTTALGDDHTVIAQRMERIRKNMEARNVVVSPDDARRHQAGKSEREPDDPESLGADSDRGEGLGQVAFVCRPNAINEGQVG